MRLQSLLFNMVNYNSVISACKKDHKSQQSLHLLQEILLQYHLTNMTTAIVTLAVITMVAEPVLHRSVGS